ncbi:hypothetical protein [Streptomyces sp. N2A]|uniref:hypothetical protein n=1 Tax=Streptomyces sp. N2A TaxID=3073936 RepID=UPI00286FC3EB|nr:hypothetical protein [Streptomyces sp. N2A]
MGREADLLTLLRELDDPQWLEWPWYFSRSQTAMLFGGLVARLEGDFAARCTAEQDAQDSSEYGRVVVSAEATARGTRIVVCVSKFGSLALVCGENPAAFFGTKGAQAEGELDVADLATVDRALADLGYAVVPKSCWSVTTTCRVSCPGMPSVPAGGIASSVSSDVPRAELVPARQPSIPCGRY